MKITVKKLSELHKPAHNIRRHSEKQLTEYIRSIEMFGQVTAGWSTWIALPDILKQATPARQGWMKPLAVSAGFLGGDILEHTEP